MDLEWYRTYNYFEGEDGSVLEICFYDYGDFEVIVNGEIWFYFNKYDCRVGDNGTLEYIKGKNIFSFYPEGYVGIYSRGNEDYYY